MAENLNQAADYLMHDGSAENPAPGQWVEFGAWFGPLPSVFAHWPVIRRYRVLTRDEARAMAAGRDFDGMDFAASEPQGTA